MSGESSPKAGPKGSPRVVPGHHPDLHGGAPGPVNHAGEAVDANGRTATNNNYLDNTHQGRFDMSRNDAAGLANDVGMGPHTGVQPK